METVCWSWLGKGGKRAQKEVEERAKTSGYNSYREEDYDDERGDTIRFPPSLRFRDLTRECNVQHAGA